MLFEILTALNCVWLVLILRMHCKLADQVDRLETWKWTTIAREKQRIKADRIADSQGHSVHEEPVKDERFTYTPNPIIERDAECRAMRREEEVDCMVKYWEAREEAKRREALALMEEPAGEASMPQQLVAVNQPELMAFLSSMNADPGSEDCFPEFTHCRDCCAMIYCQRYGVCVLKDAGHMA